ncbi:unnamed protein product, partial [Owenia fusiformis]
IICIISDVCSSQIDELRQRRIHTKIENRLQLIAFDKVTQKFLCKVCHKSFKNRDSLLDHARLHTGENLHSCSFCSKQFVSNSKLVTHQRTHTGEKPFQCKICLKTFGDRSSHIRHMKRTHLFLQEPT